jgi:E3 ubiquitin-protein ligase makorin
MSDFGEEFEEEINSPYPDEISNFIEDYHFVDLDHMIEFNLNLSDDENDERYCFTQEYPSEDEKSWENEEFSEEELDGHSLEFSGESEEEEIENSEERYLQDMETLLSLLDLIENLRSKPKRKKKQVCRFNLMGKCNKGEQCQFIHESTEEKKEISSTVPCEFFKMGKCKFGNFCKFLHEEKKEISTCSICVDSIHSRFGILESCDHTFCLSCIMDWRKENIENSKKCPICREKSNFVIPSNNHVTGEEKKELILIYKEKSKEIPCKFEKICGSCAFGEHCFFKHK